MLPTTLQIAMLRAPFFLRLAQRRERVGGLPRLRDDDRERVLRDDRIAVAVLGSVVDVDRHARERLDQELADQRRVPRRAAREDDDALDLAQRLVGDLDLVQEHPAALERRAAEHGLLDRPRLLEDLLEHEVLVSGLLRHDRIPRHPRALRRHARGRRSR